MAIFPFSSIEGALICLQPYPEADTFPDLIPRFRSLGVGGGCGGRDLDTNNLLLGALSCQWGLFAEAPDPRNTEKKITIPVSRDWWRGFLPAHKPQTLELMLVSICKNG